MLVGGVDSSTQSCKVVIRDAATGALVRYGRAPHPDGTEVDPEAWWLALRQAVTAAGGLDDVAAVSIGGQQHGLVALDAGGRVIRPALLWNDTRSADAALALRSELGDAAIAARTGSIPVASFTSTKLRWLRDAEPEHAARIAAVALPHDWLTWRLRGYGPHNPRLDELVTDRSDASGTGYFDPARGEYDRELLELILGSGEASGAADVLTSGAHHGNSGTADHGNSGITLPTVLEPHELRLVAGDLPEFPKDAGRDAAADGAAAAGDADAAADSGADAAGVGAGAGDGSGRLRTPPGLIVGAGAGDNAAAALGLDARAGDVIVSIGTSGTVFAVSPTPVVDASGTVAGFADATGNFLPLVATLNAARVLDAVAALLDVDHAELGRLAVEGGEASAGPVLVPWFEGERTPNLPTATATLSDLTLASMTRAGVARAAIEGMLCGLADGLDAVLAQGVPAERVLLIGGAAGNPGVQAIASQVFGRPITVPEPGEYVADGMARQAAWALTGERPTWPLAIATELESDHRPGIRSRYARARDAAASVVQ